VLINLIGNAIKFTHKGSVVLRVNYKDATLLFEVEDTGPGIAETEMKDLFDPFIQTSSGKKSFEGTGLGLTISRQYIELMGGNISVESKVGKGSIFRFEINVTLTDSSEVEGRLETRRVIGMEPDQPIYRMLII